jgi:hypothetical protein
VTDLRQQISVEIAGRGCKGGIRHGGRDCPVCVRTGPRRLMWVRKTAQRGTRPGFMPRPCIGQTGRNFPRHLLMQIKFEPARAFY